VNVDDLADMKRRLEDCNRNKKQQLQQGDDDDDKQKPDRDQDNQVHHLHRAVNQISKTTHVVQFAVDRSALNWKTVMFI